MRIHISWFERYGFPERNQSSIFASRTGVDDSQIEVGKCEGWVAGEGFFQLRLRLDEVVLVDQGVAQICTGLALLRIVLQFGLKLLTRLLILLLGPEQIAQSEVDIRGAGSGTAISRPYWEWM
jgi:hypothetical protein